MQSGHVKTKRFPKSSIKSQFSSCRILHLNPLLPVETERSEGSTYKGTWATLTSATVWVDNHCSYVSWGARRERKTHTRKEEYFPARPTVGVAHGRGLTLPARTSAGWKNSVRNTNPKASEEDGGEAAKPMPVLQG